MTKNFYCVVRDPSVAQTNASFKLLENACHKRNIAFSMMTPPLTAYALEYIPQLKPGGLYRVTASNKRTSLYTYALRLRNPSLKHWFIKKPSGHLDGGSASWLSVMTAEEQNISILPTLYGQTGTVNQELLNTIKQKLDGFPVIIKKSGGSHGSGVMIAESSQSLKALVGHIVGNTDSDEFALRKYITNARHFRAIVLGDEVISSIEYRLPADDFRTNTSNHPDVVPAELPPKFAALAVKAAKNEGVAIGGVDILVDKDGNGYVAEVNTPCNFACNQQCTGEDVAGKIVEFFCE